MVAQPMFVIASAVRQSKVTEYLDCRSALAVTVFQFMVWVRHRPGCRWRAIRLPDISGKGRFSA